MKYLSVDTGNFITHSCLCLQPYTTDLQMSVMGSKVINHVSVKDAFWQPNYAMDIMTVKICLMKVTVSIHCTK
jgi:hypothetical protein